MAIDEISENRRLWMIRLVVYFLLIVVVVKDSLAGYPFYTDLKLRYIDDAVIALLYPLLFALIVYRRRVSPVVLAGAAFMGLFVLYVFFQQLFLGFNVLAYPLGWRDNYWYLIVPMFLLVAVRGSDELRRDAIETVTTAMVAYASVEVAAVFFQQAYSLAATGKLLFADPVTGTLGSGQAHILAVSLVLCLPALIIRKRFLLAFLCIQVLFLASARAVILITLTSLLAVLVWKGLKRLSGMKMPSSPRLSAALAAAMLLLIVVDIFAYNAMAPGAKINLGRLVRQQSRDVYDLNLDKLDLAGQEQEVMAQEVVAQEVMAQEMMAQEVMAQEMMAQEMKKKNAGSRRLGVVIFSLKFLDENGSLWLGSGPASYASRSARYVSGWLYRLFKEKFPFKDEMLPGGSSLNVWLVEYGLVGAFLLFVLPYAAIIVLSMVYSEMFLLPVLVYSMGSLANKVSEGYATALLFWLVVALACLIGGKRGGAEGGGGLEPSGQRRGPSPSFPSNTGGGG